MEELSNIIYKNILGLGASEEQAQQIMKSLQKEHIQFLAQVYQQNPNNEKAMAEAVAQVIQSIQKGFHGMKLQYINKLNNKQSNIESHSKGGCIDCSNKKNRFKKLEKGNSIQNNRSKQINNKSTKPKRFQYGGFFNSQIDPNFAGEVKKRRDTLSELRANAYNYLNQQEEGKSFFGDGGKMNDLGYLPASYIKPNDFGDVYNSKVLDIWRASEDRLK